MMIQIFSILLVIISGILCSGAQQGVSSTQTGQTLQIQPNVRKYNKHTSTEKPCTTAGSPTGTRKDKPDNYSDSQDYVPIGGTAGPGYPYPYPYPYQPLGPYQPVGPYLQPTGPVLVPSGNPYRPLQYPYEPQYAVDGAPLPPYNYAPYYPAGPPYVGSSPPYYPATPQPLYEQQPTVVDAYRSPLYPPQPLDQPQFFRQPGAAGGLPPYYRAHAYNRPSPFIQQRDIAAAPPYFQQRDAPFPQQRDAAATPAAATATTVAATNNAEPQYEQQQSGPFDGNQFHY
ncbi:leucine-rich repeat extensin-like protein 5 isoform X1 [Melanaphis sacchari]|uniref:leucine-rich repeat extensin-like protein 5 isoform X1 n=1 Tax=Melanaphis sacchari TaxID=742174 RepID=UPI000DC13ABA|nr:leucine-rich repeat extensin-like protein 5 isoform X1 [Melanaphis sacchari]